MDYAPEFAPPVDNGVWRRIALVVAAFLALGCQTTPVYTQAQLNAIETREVEATTEETFNAAASALFDAGYTIAMSDRSAGLISGSAGKDNSAERIWVSPYIADTKFVMSVQVRSIAPKRCAVRVKTSVNGEPRVDKAAIDRIWTLMQRQVLMKEPSVIEQPADKQR